MATGPAPGVDAITEAIMSGLGMHSSITSTMVPTVKFEPTIGIAAGRIAKLGVDIRSFREPLRRAIKNVMGPSIRRNFDEGGRPPWDDLSEFTLAMRAQEGTGDQILVRSGKLRKVAGQLNIWSITPTSAVVSDLPQAVWYGKVHQEGYGGLSASKAADVLLKHKGNITKAAREIASSKVASFGTKTSPDIPARPFLVIQPEDETAIEETFIAWLDERVALTMWR